MPVDGPGAAASPLHRPGGASVGHARLREFSLSAEVLVDAVRRGAQRGACRSALALPSAAGTDLYHDTMEDLAQALTRRGWARITVASQPRLEHPDGLLAITVSSARGAGVPASRPRTHRKGPATQNYLARVPAQDALFDLDDPADAPPRGTVPEADLWFLLLDRYDGYVTAELSRPSEVNAAGQVVGWSERVLLPSVRTDGEVADPWADAADPPDDPYVVAVDLRD